MKDSPPKLDKQRSLLARKAELKKMNESMAFDEDPERRSRANTVEEVADDSRKRKIKPLGTIPNRRLLYRTVGCAAVHHPYATLIMISIGCHFNGYLAQISLNFTANCT